MSTFIQRWTDGTTVFRHDIVSGRIWRELHHENSEPSSSERTFLQDIWTEVIGDEHASLCSFELNPIQCHKKSSSKIPVFFHRGRLIFGPKLDFEKCVCIDCLSVRLLAATPHGHVVLSLWASQNVELQDNGWLRKYLQANVSLIKECLDRVHQAHGADALSIEIKSGELISHRIIALPGGYPHEIKNDTLRRLLSEEGAINDDYQVEQFA